MNAVSGSTAGHLLLEQIATGGSGGFGPGGAAGDARSELSAQNSGGGSLEIHSIADGGWANDPNGVAGNAFAAATGLDRAGQSVNVSAVAYGGILGASGGSASLGTVYGSSTAGGLVIVDGEAFGGGGTIGAPVELDNAVDGATTGELDLSQFASGGEATGDGDVLVAPGEAVSRLGKSGSFQSLYVGAGAQGGGVGGAASLPAAGAPAFAEAAATNDAGSAWADADAQGGGGQGATGSSDGGTGASALSTARATTSGDGHAVTVTSNADGGRGGDVYGYGPDTRGGKGGSATAEAFGQALGDSLVDVSASAVGELGGDPVHAGRPGDDGDAIAHATAMGAGASRVHAAAFADAETRAFDPNLAAQPLGGDATALSSALGLHEVVSDAVASGKGNRSARSQVAASGVAPYVAVAMSAPSAPSSDQLRAWSGISSALPQQQIIVYPPGPQDFFVGSAALALALPSQDDAAAWATGAPVVQAAIGTQGRVLAIGGFSGSGASPSQSGELHVTLTPGTVAGGEELSLGFVGLDTTGAGFSVLHVDVQLNELIVFDGTFHSPAEASADLDDAVKAIASGEFLSQSLVQLVLGYDVEIAAAADHFTEKFALFATPEPGCPLLAALVLVALAARRRRESGG